MTSNELRAKFERAYRIIRAERRMREHVFRADADKQAAKVAEMDELLAILTEMKDLLKEQTGLIEQPRLLDVPKRAEYN